jgi:hypothetical protein
LIVPSLNANYQEAASSGPADSFRLHLPDGLLHERDGAMIVHPADRSIVKWAVEDGFVHGYVREYGLPEPALRVQLGMTTAFFHAGRLVHWRAEAAAQHLDQLMFELTRLFGFCHQAGAYPEQRVFLQPGELAALQRPYNKAG